MKVLKQAEKYTISKAASINVPCHNAESCSFNYKCH